VSTPLLNIEHVSQRYGDNIVVRDISFSLQRGTIGCLLGPSGCGKTTLLRGIAGFEPVSAGTIRLNGDVVSEYGFTLAPEKRRVGMVFQDYALFPHLTCERNIAFGLHDFSRGERQKRVDEMLDMVGLRESARLYPAELSGGQQQRVALARALAPNPELLLLDEPFSNLDVELRERLCAEVRDILKRNNATAIIVTHDQDEAFAIADEIGVIAAGALQQWSAPYDLYHEPRSRFVADFIGQGALLPGLVLSPICVEVELGLLPGEFVYEIGTAVDVLLRPDDIIHDDDSPRVAQVVAKAFRGAQFLYTLQLPSGQQVLSLVPSHHDHPLGSHIGIRLHADHVVIFPQEPI